MIVSFLIELILYWHTICYPGFLTSHFYYMVCMCVHLHIKHYDVVSILDYTKNKRECLDKIALVFIFIFALPYE